LPYPSRLPHTHPLFPYTPLFRSRVLAAQHNIRFDAVNSNTFQDQKDQQHSYKFGSLQHVKKEVRSQAIEHNLEVIHYGKELGSRSEEHTSELQSRENLVCRLLLE